MTGRSALLAALALLLMVLIASPADARTWRVERDGSGDFTTIRPAIEASAPGDTVLLGPGRYDESAPFTVPGWTEITYVPITVDSLTLRGVDRETVIIGPTEPNFQGFGPKGVLTDVTITKFLLESVTIENVHDGAFLLEKSDVRDCVVRYCDLGIVEFTTGALVESSELRLNKKGIITLTGCSDLTIENCTFVDNGLGVSINRTLDAVVRACRFTASRWATGGIQYSENATGIVEDCGFDGTQAGVSIRNKSDVTVERNTFQGHEYALFVFDGSVARGSGSVFRGSFAAIRMATTSTAFLSNNHILKSDGWAVHCDGFNLHDVDIDLRNNYWGTDSADSISAWIFDGNDPQDPFYVENMSNVLYEPFSPVPVEAKESSVGGLKSIFRRP